MPRAFAAMSRSRISFPRAVVMPRMREHNIDFAARKSGRESNDPEFVAKAADVVGLYVDPPAKAIVICVDERPSKRTAISRHWSVYSITSSARAVKVTGKVIPSAVALFKLTAK